MIMDRMIVDFIDALSTRLINERFKYVKTSESFKRRNNIGHDIIRLMMYPEPDKLRINIEIGVRDDEQFRLFNQVFKGTVYTIGSQATTLGHYLQVIKAFAEDVDTKTVESSVSIYSEDEIEDVVNQVMDDIQKYALPFFETYSKRENIYQISLLDEGKLTSLMIIHEYRAIYAMIYAYLLDRANVDTVVQHKRTYLASLAIPENQMKVALHTFETFVERFQKLLLNES